MTENIKAMSETELLKRVMAFLITDTLISGQRARLHLNEIIKESDNPAAMKELLEVLLETTAEAIQAA